MQVRSVLASGLVAALALGSTGCAQIVVGVWLATSDSGGSGSGGGGGGAPALTTVPISVSLTPPTGSAMGGTLVEVEILTAGVPLRQAGIEENPSYTLYDILDENTLVIRIDPRPEGNLSGVATLEIRIRQGSVQWVGAATITYHAGQHRVTGLGVQQGPAAGGTEVPVLGEGFVPGMSARFGVNASPLVTFVSGTELRVTSPAGVPGSAVSLVVDHPAGFTATYAGSFLYETPQGPPPPPPPPALPSFPAGNVTFALVTGEPAIHQASLSGALSAAKVADLPAGSDPRGIVAESGDVLVVLDGAGQRLLRFSRATRQVTAMPALDVAPTAQRRGLVRLNRQGEVLGVLPGMELRHVNLDRGQTHGFSTLSGAARVEALAADPWGTIWAAGSPGDDDQAERLYRVDLETGVLTDVGPFGVDLDHLTWGSDGVLYGLQAPAGANAMLYRVDPRSGVATFMEDTRVSDVRGFVQVAGIFNHRGPNAPWVRSTVPETVLAGTTTEVVLVGEGLGPETTITTTATGTRIVGDRTGPGDQRVLSVRYDGGSPASELQFYAANADGDSRFTLRGRPASDVFIGAGEVVRFAGTFRCRSLTIQAGGTLRGVGLQPLVVFSSGPVQIDGTLDVSGHTGSVPRLPMGTGTNGASSDTYICGHGGDGGPGGGGGGGGGAAERAVLTQGGEGGWGYTGGGGGGGSTDRASGRGGLGAEGFGAPAVVATVGFSDGGDGGRRPGPGGQGGFGGGGGGTGSPQGIGGEGGPTSGQTLQIGRGGGAGAQQSSDGTGGGGGSYATAGENGRLSGGSSSGGGPAGLIHGNPELVPLAGGSGGGGGSGRGAFNGLAAGGGGGGGALVLASLGTITVGATGAILANGGDGGREVAADGEGGAGSGGALLLQAPTVSVTTGARLEARGGARPNGWQVHGYRGAGGDGRVRVDAPALLIDAGAVSEATFAAATAPAAGFFGAAVPTVAVTTPPDSLERLTLSYTVTDADANLVFIEVQVSENGGPFRAATPHTDSAPTFAVTSSSGGQVHTFFWAANADLAPGTSSVVLRVRAIDARVGPWATTGAFNVTSS